MSKKIKKNTSNYLEIPGSNEGGGNESPGSSSSSSTGSINKSWTENSSLLHSYHSKNNIIKTSSSISPSGISNNKKKHSNIVKYYTDDDVDDDSREAKEREEELNRLAYNNILKTGRQRKKIASRRSQDSQLYSKKKKRRIYFCCISNEININALYNTRHELDSFSNFGYQYHLYDNVLHLYKPDYRETQINRFEQEKPRFTEGIAENPRFNPENLNRFDLEKPRLDDVKQEIPEEDPNLLSSYSDIDMVSRRRDESESIRETEREDNILNTKEDSSERNKMNLLYNSKEIFIFEFGVAVFWSCTRQEERDYLNIFRQYCTQDIISPNEFVNGEDDMEFIITNCKEITIYNDVFTLPEDTIPKNRLALSYAIAQSSVLSIFESRIESKITEYKTIPGTLASQGRVKLSEIHLGMMIGEVYVIRHDVNLHSEVLDTPDFFWKEKIYEHDYNRLSDYLEMSGRTELINKRLDMLRDLLDVLQQQMENAHAVKLEWIVIYLIVAEVVLQGLTIITNGLYAK